MALNFFKTVRSTLDQSLAAYCRVKGMSTSDALAAAKGFVRENSKAYFTPGAALNYSDPLCRIAYLYVYVAAHANLVDNAFHAFGHLRDAVEERFKSGQQLKICSLGGGPGSELLGLAKYTERVSAGRCLEIDFALIDNITEWDETWNALRNDIQCQLERTYGARRAWPLRISHSFLPLDISNPHCFENLPARFQDIDLFIFNFVVSEMVDRVGNLTDVVRLLAQRSSDSAYFLFIDRTESRIQRGVEAIIGAAGLFSIGSFEQSEYMDFDEQKADLGDWNVELGYSPKVTLNAFYILAGKEPFVSF